MISLAGRFSEITSRYKSVFLLQGFFFENRGGVDNHILRISNRTARSRIVTQNIGLTDSLFGYLSHYSEGNK